MSDEGGAELLRRLGGFLSSWTGARAAGRLREALELAEGEAAAWRLAPEDDPGRTEVESCLATSLYETGRDLERARDLFWRVLRVRERTLPEDHPDLRAARGNLAWTLAHLGEGEAAVDLCLRMASSIERGLSSLGSVLSASRLERFIEASGRHVSQILSFARDAGPRGVDLDRACFSLIESLRGAGARAARVLRLLLRRSGDARVRALKEELERVTLRIPHVVSRAGVAADPGGREALRAELRDLVRLRDDLEGRLRGILGADLGARGDVSAVARALSPRSAAVGYWRYTRWARAGAGEGAWAGTESVAALVLRPDGTLARVELGAAREIDEAIDLWYGANAMLRAQLRRRGEEDLTAATLAEDAELAEAAARRAGERLRELVWDPVIEEAGTDVERAVVALDDSLHLIPLDALPEGTGVVGDRVAVERRASLVELLEAREPLGEGGFLGFGAVDFDAEPRAVFPERLGGSVTAVSSAGAEGEACVPAMSPAGLFAREASWALRGGLGRFKPLPETRQEVRRVGGLYGSRFPGSLEVLEDAEASKAAFVALAARSRFLHVATHGFVASEDLWRALDGLHGGGGPGAAPRGLGAEILDLAPSVLCGLAFAGANRTLEGAGGPDGLLTAEELSGLDLSGCELATLSACSTYAGVLRRAGQGLASLHRALHVAGVRTALTSLWPVADDAARELMEDFYRRVWEGGEAKGRALWNAKRALREKRDASGHPVYGVADWAGWVLTGDPE